MLQALKQQANLSHTENGAVTYASSGSHCLDLFFAIGALRDIPEAETEARFLRALAENPDWAMKILSYGRDIRGGLGERKVFRALIRWLSYQEPQYLRRNLHLVPEYGRWDDVLAVMGTPCEADALALIREQLQKDLQSQGEVSLLGKWLPSVNTSSRETVAMAKHIARSLHMTDQQYRKMLVSLRALVDFGSSENALAVVDTSGSMFWYGHPTPGEVAVSLGIYFAEHNTGPFRNHFITFSSTPELVEVQGRDICEKARNCRTAPWGGSTNLEAVFRLILDAAVQHHMTQSDLPRRLYIISDMEFDCCMRDASLSNFANAKAMYEAQGYALPEVIFWNVQARTRQSPVERNEAGVALVSGCTHRLFSMVASGAISPMTVMLEVLNSQRYAEVCA